VIRIPDCLKNKRELIAEAVMQTHKHVKTVLQQTSPVSNEFRLRRLEWIAGEKKTETFYREYGCVFKVDLEKCYFSPRLSYERMRIAKQVKPGEAIVNMFAGVGCYSILIAKHSQASRIYSIDLNPDAVQYMLENILLNRVHDRVIPIHGDSAKIVQQKLKNSADRVLMPLPEKAYEYLDYALLALKPHGGWVHYYDFEHAKKPENPIRKTEARVTEKLRKLNVDFEMAFHRIVRGVGPNWFQVALDIMVKHLAF
jgi:tRNA (guanine37-N1)-methyltransferase